MRVEVILEKGSVVLVGLYKGFAGTGKIEKNINILRLLLSVFLLIHNNYLVSYSNHTVDKSSLNN